MAKTLQLFGGEEAEETVKFAAMFSRVFLLHQYKKFLAGNLPRDPFKLSYQSEHDFCLKMHN